MRGRKVDGVRRSPVWGLTCDHYELVLLWLQILFTGERPSVCFLQIPDLQSHLSHRGPQTNVPLTWYRTWAESARAQSGRSKQTEPVQTSLGNARPYILTVHHVLLAVPPQGATAAGQPAAEHDSAARFPHNHVAVGGRSAGEHRQEKRCQIPRVKQKKEIKRETFYFNLQNNYKARLTPKTFFFFFLIFAGLGLLATNIIYSPNSSLPIFFILSVLKW